MGDQDDREPTLELVDELDDPALAAFHGEANLHDLEAEIDALALAYEQLKEQYAAAMAH